MSVTLIGDIGWHIVNIDCVRLHQPIFCKKTPSPKIIYILFPFLHEHIHKRTSKSHIMQSLYSGVMCSPHRGTEMWKRILSNFSRISCNYFLLIQGTFECAQIMLHFELPSIFKLKEIFFLKKIGYDETLNRFWFFNQVAIFSDNELFNILCLLSGHKRVATGLNLRTLFAFTMGSSIIQSWMNSMNGQILRILNILTPFGTT